MGYHRVLWFTLNFIVLNTSSVIDVHTEKEDNYYEAPPIAVGLLGLQNLNLSMDYLPVPLTPSSQENEHIEHLENEPYFDPTMPKNVTAYSGKSAYLACKVFNLGNRTVSWIRHTDIHILSVGTYTYTSDQRYVTLYDGKTGDWTLQIKWVNTRDEGTYGCQLNTQPVKSYFITLTVIGSMPSTSTYSDTWEKNEFNLHHKMLADVAVPAAYIAGGSDMYVDQGSTLNLSCILNTSDSQLFWYHEGEIINYDSARGGITIIVEKGNNTISTLRIKNADFTDSGNYTCSPSNANSASTIVHVIKGDQPAAMHKGGAAGETEAAIGLGVLFIFLYNFQPSTLPCIPIIAYYYYVMAR